LDGERAEVGKCLDLVPVAVEQQCLDLVPHQATKHKLRAVGKLQPSARVRAGASAGASTRDAFEAPPAARDCSRGAHVLVLAILRPVLGVVKQVGDADTTAAVALASASHRRGAAWRGQRGPLACPEPLFYYERLKKGGKVIDS
jgi:hypothetical protein